MRTLRLSTVAAVCALGTVICVVVGAVAMGSSGVEVLIPETGEPGRAWIAAVDAAGGWFFPTRVLTSLGSEDWLVSIGLCAWLRRHP